MRQIARVLGAGDGMRMHAKAGSGVADGAKRNWWYVDMVKTAVLGEAET
jgi:hypothetical protein